MFHEYRMGQKNLPHFTFRKNRQEQPLSFQSRSNNSWATISLHRWSPKSFFKIRLTLRTERLNAAECLLAERFGDRKMDFLTILMFFGVRTSFRLSAQTVALKFLSQSSTVFRSATGSRLLSWKWFQKFLKVAVTDSLLVRKFSTINARHISASKISIIHQLF